MKNTANYAKRSEKAIWKLTAAQFLALTAQAAYTKDGLVVIIPKR